MGKSMVGLPSENDRVAFTSDGVMSTPRGRSFGEKSLGSRAAGLVTTRRRHYGPKLHCTITRRVVRATEHQAGDTLIKDSTRLTSALSSSPSGSLRASS